MGSVGVVTGCGQWVVDLLDYLIMHYLRCIKDWVKPVQAQGISDLEVLYIRSCYQNETKFITMLLSNARGRATSLFMGDN